MLFRKVVFTYNVRLEEEGHFYFAMLVWPLRFCLGSTILVLRLVVTNTWSAVRFVGRGLWRPSSRTRRPLLIHPTFDIL